LEFCSFEVHDDFGDLLTHAASNLESIRERSVP
jgi:hypothetical protein